MFGVTLLLPPLVARTAMPTLRFDRPEIQATLGVAFDKAIENLVAINTVDSDPKQYNRTGLMRENRFMRAGGGYHQPWTRDAAINSWNAGSLFEPEVARDTLWSVTVPDERGAPIVQRDNQWWDKVVWIIGSWNHYQTTHDRGFLTMAYGVSERLLAEMRASRYSVKEELFQGPSFFNDGIAGYPSPPASVDDGGSSFVLDHADTDRVMALSTNCVYVGAYRAAASMARELGRPSKSWDQAADALKSSINRRFWMKDKDRFAYLVFEDGKIDPSEEGCGLAFSILFDIAGPSRASSILANTHLDPFGITDVYPAFPRFSDERPGRHNAIVWPMVQGMWARAATKMGDERVFARETQNLARLALGSEGHFFEIYNGHTGKPDGGWQNGRHWDSAPDQTWSATAYLSMVVNGLFGMRFESKGLRFEPLVPDAWDGATLSGVPYGAGILNLRLEGGGKKVKRVLLDGKATRWVPHTLSGNHTVKIEMG